MKKLFSALLFLATLVTTNAQDTIFSDSFDRMSLGSNYTTVGSPTISLDGTDMSISGGSATYGKYAKYTDWGTCLEHWQLIMSFKVGTQNAAAQGPFIGIKTASAFGNRSVICSFGHGTGAAKGKTFILAGSSGESFTTKATSSVQNVALNDEIRMTLTRDGLTITCLTENITNSTSTTISYTFNLVYNSTSFMHNTGYPYIGTLGGTQVVHDFTYTTTEEQNIQTLFIGNSITHGLSVDSVHKRYAAKTMDTSTVEWQVNAGGGDYTANTLTKLKELCWIKPQYAVMMLGGNDVQFGISSATYQNNYDSIVQTLKDSGIIVIHCKATPRNAYNMTSLNNWITSTYAGIDSIVDTYTPLKAASGTGLNATYDCNDHVHPNAAGQALIATTIINAVAYIREW